MGERWAIGRRQNLDDTGMSLGRGDIKAGDAVLIKGSRATAMERVDAAITARFATSRPSAPRLTATAVAPASTGKERTAP